MSDADITNNQQRLNRERAFHNETFAEGKRAQVQKYYDTTAISKDFYKARIKGGISGKKVLEYGCGPGSQAFLLASLGAEVTAIDISEVAIEMARKEAEAEGLDIDFKVMNAESLQFEENRFDLICGSGILHHLELEKAYSEIRRMLKKDGTAVFYEPLGHNPFINYYRNRTPQLRTEDEHPLLMQDLQLAKKVFSQMEVTFFHMTSIAAAVVPFVPARRLLAKSLNLFDKLLFAIIPGVKKFAWVVVIELKK